MKPTEVKKALASLWSTRWPAFIWGPPGVGKSSVVAQLAKERGLDLVDIRAPLLDPTDLRGIPAVVGDRAVWFPPAFLPRSDARPGILFFDELNAATPIVQASLYQLVLDRRIGEYVLPPGWTIVAAGNREEDRSLAYRMPDALANRFIHLEFTPNFDDWRNWALDRGIHGCIIALLGLRRELLFKPGKERAFPTPRSWEMASDVISAFGGTEGAEDALVGTVGPAAAIELLALLRDESMAKVVAEAIARPADCPIPTDVSQLYVLVSHLARRVEEAQVVRASCVLLPRLPIEYAAILAKDVIRLKPLVVREKEFKAFFEANREVFR